MRSIKIPKFSHKKTTLSEEEVIRRSIKFFAENEWLIQNQAESEATFKGRPPIPLKLLFLTVLGFLFFVIPGVIVYRALVKRATRFQNILVKVRPIAGNSEVTVIYSRAAENLINKFLNLLPPALTGE